jgi:hypothetical protein
MSWSVYFTAKSPARAKSHLRELTKSEAKPHGVPADAVEFLVTAIDLASIPETSAVKVEASGHSPNGSTNVKVEQTFVVE